VKQKTSAVALIARHGETPSNLAGRYAGRSKEPLTKRGRRQIRDLATRLSGYDVAEIWTSEISRGLESAELLAAALGVEVKVDSRLNEISMGPWEGLTELEVAKRFPDAHALWQESPDHLVIEGRETLAGLAARVGGAVQQAISRPTPVLLMTHVAPMRVAVLELLRLPLRLYKRVQVSNADCVVIQGWPIDVRRLSEIHSLRQELCPG
jgi:probable phosphoglycerate mutase